MVTDSQWESVERSRQRDGRIAAAGGIVMLALFVVPAMLLGTSVASGPLRYVVTSLAVGFVAAPFTIITVVVAERRNHRSEERLRHLTHRLTEALAAADDEAARGRAQANRQRLESRLADALDMAEDEPGVVEVVERSLGTLLPGSQWQLLLADNSHAHLVRMAESDAEGAHAGCGVDSPERCPAARRAQVQAFEDSEALEACPKLRHRGDRRSALCVPVSIMGRTVGVIHTTSQPGTVRSDDQILGLTTVAKLAGTRIGLLRVMAETQLQAGTDTLTGLLNRRSLERRLSDLRREGSAACLAIGDLDGFKQLNDTHGHESGDRALRVFARVLSDSVRSQDITCRYGGEEFVIVFPGYSVSEATEALTRVRDRLDAAVTVGSLPKVTASFGVTELEPDEDLEAALRRADQALFRAKAGGRDRTVVHADDELPEQDGKAVPIGRA